MIKEFQRLKDEESSSKRLEWDFQRTLSKINYRIHTFVAAALAGELTRRSIDSAYTRATPAQRKLSKNKYTPGAYDTTVTYQQDCDSVVYIA